MPTHLVNVIKHMYDGDEYFMIDGAKTTSTGNSTVLLRGVKQRCPSSPLLFFLFINYVDDEFGSGFMGAVRPFNAALRRVKEFGTVQTWVQSAAPKKYFSFTLPHQPRTLEIFNLHQPRTGVFA